MAAMSKITNSVTHEISLNKRLASGTFWAPMQFPIMPHDAYYTPLGIMKSMASS